MDLDNNLELYWHSTYAIVVSLMRHHPNLSPLNIGLLELAESVVALPGFDDDPDMVTERILLDIQITWFEESTL